jgi:hypothetical protein
MPRLRAIIPAIIACLLIAAGAYLWTSRLMGSLMTYRSPLHAMPPAPGQPTGAPLARRLVIVLIDALRDDTSRRAQVMPYLNDLRERGASATMHSRPPSYSQPGFATLFTGAWPDISDSPAFNADYAQIETWTQDDLFSAAHRAGLRTAISGYFWFEKLIPQGSVDASFYTSGEESTADRAVVDAARGWLDSGDAQLVLVHLDQVDWAGHHEGGPRDPRWDQAARRADDLLREMTAALDLNRDSLLVISDHGQIDRGGHGGQDAVVLREPLVLVGAGIRPGRYGDIQMVDVAPTAAALLGANIPASNQGRVRTEMLDLPPGREAAIRDAEASQQARLAVAYSSAIGREVTVPPSDDPVATTQAALAAARAGRLNTERLPRAIIALVLAVVPAIILFRRRGRTVAWLGGGAVAYIALFNLWYIVLAGWGYSLSFLTGETELLLTVGGGALGALVVAWAGVTFGLGIFRRSRDGRLTGPQSPIRNAEISLGLTLVILYLLALPVLLSYAVNGLLATWTLPDFAIVFTGFLSALQALFVALGGLVLAGAAAAIGWALPRDRHTVRAG